MLGERLCKGRILKHYKGHDKYCIIRNIITHRSSAQDILFRWLSQVNAWRPSYVIILIFVGR